jgi:S1-C subfamily serine protease
VPDLLTRGRVPRGYLGIGAYPVRVTENAATKAGEPALIVVSVEPKGPAAAAGVLQGDLLLSVNGESASSLGKLKSLLDSGRTGAKARLGLLRAGQPHEAEVTLGSV